MPCDECRAYLDRTEKIQREDSCPAISWSGRRGEPIRCGYERGHSGEHSWASLPTFTNGQTEAEQRALRAEARVAELAAAVLLARNALNGIRLWMMTIRSNEAPPAFQAVPMMEALNAARAALSSDGSAAAEVLRAAEAFVWNDEHREVGEGDADIVRAAERKLALREAIDRWRAERASGGGKP